VSLTPFRLGFSEVHEKAEAGLAGRHKQNVVAVRRAEDAGVPADAVVLSADARFPGLGYNLIERRVAGHRVWKLARLVRVGAAELDGRRRAAALAVTQIHVDRLRRTERQAGCGVEPVEGVVGVERSRFQIGCGRCCECPFGCIGPRA
jgi:hypothetical protein